MWLLEFIFFALTLVLGWILFGYLILIWIVGLYRRRDAPVFPESWPMLSVIVPCYNEEEQIISKLENIRKFDYPYDRIEVIFADGGSDDGTVSLLEDAIKSDEPYRIVKCPVKGKINQLNHILPELRGEIVLNTDTDSRLSADALKWVAAEFTTTPNVWVVGAYCHPENTLKIERYYWDAQNKGRFMETDARTSSIVIAQCYAFRRELLDSFPEDVIADDIYVAFLANTLKYWTVYSRYAMAIETRSPQSFAEFLQHKLRKSNAFLHETLRFFYRLPDMGSFCKMMFITRISQQILLPWIMLFWILVAGVLLALFRFDVVVFGFSFLIILLFMTNRVFAAVRLPDKQMRYSIITIIKGYVVTTLILLATGISYPFFRQGSSYSRLGLLHQKNGKSK